MVGMRIAVDARPLEKRPTGVGRYLEGLLTAWLGERADDSFVLVSPRPVFTPPSLEGRVEVAPSRALPGTVWLQTAAGPAATRAGADAFFGCLGIVPLAGGPPSVATVHDLTPLLFPEWHSWKNRLGFAPFIAGSVRAARRIAAVSEHSRKDLVARFPTAAGKTTVVHNGVEIGAARTGGPPPNEGRPYVLTLGTLEPRKNLPRLVEAMESIWDRRPDFPDLVLAGAPGWGVPGLGARLGASRHAARIRPAGYLEGGERGRWMAGARVFAYPSLYEGFGLPPLEAMALGTPVVASSAASLPEVVGDAGLLPDPEDVGAIARALERAHDDEAFRRDAAAKGPARAATFTWTSAARKMRTLFEEALS
jgi:glycosyltransferase involved in cell wall biosynthesis